MARKSTRKTSTRNDQRRVPHPGSDKPARERIIDAFMALLAEKPIEQIGFTEIAAQAGVSLSELREHVRLDARDPRRAGEGRPIAPCWPAATPRLRRSRRASACSTC